MYIYVLAAKNKNKKENHPGKTAEKIDLNARSSDLEKIQHLLSLNHPPHHDIENILKAVFAAA